MPTVVRSHDPPLRVFLSYRRDDAGGHAGRLYDLLAARYGHERVFMDIDAVPGVVTGWQVQSAGGPIRLIVLRGELEPGGRSTLRRVQVSAEQDVRGDGRQTFRTRLPIEKGDVVGLQFSTGAYGNAPNSQGTWLESWTPPLAAERRASNTDSEYDYQLLYNAVIERDADADRFGDASQDECPKVAGRQEDC